jgi:eukaryotic-like serine/threonine-protein kinase
MLLCLAMSHPSNRAGAMRDERSVPAPPTEDAAGLPLGRGNERSSQRPGGPESLVGRTLGGRYLIERVVGEGGMGAVYQAEHTHMHKRLAVKVLHPEMSRVPEVVSRFEREAMAAAHIDHPNVAAATDFGKLDDGSFFLVLEYVEGKSLREAIDDGPMELGRAFHIARQMTAGLARAHALGIVHRDLKPENVMLVRRDEDDDFVKVLDFGIAKVPVGSLMGEHEAQGEALTQVGMVYGTPEYMAPEQALGQPVDARADLYAFGVMMFEMITGARPFNHDSKVTLLGMQVTAAIPRMSERSPDADVPPEVEAIVARLLAKEAGARYGDAKELIDSLDTVAILLAGRGRMADPFAAKSMIGAPRASSAALGGARLAATGSTVKIAAFPQSGIASLVGASFGSILKSASPWMSRKVTVRVASALGIALIVGLSVALGRSMRPSPAVTVPMRSGGSESAVTPRSVSTASGTDPVASAAQARIDRGDYTAVIDELTTVERDAPDRADVHRLLERAYTGLRNTPGAMHEAGAWLTVDPAAAADVHLQEDVRNAALVREGQDDAFTLLESRMATRGIDLLYDIGYSVSGRMYPQAGARARKVLDSPEVRKRASPALTVLLAFREAKTCEQKHALLEAARDSADARLLSQLQPYESTRGCGFLGRNDCSPCMHRDHLLDDARQAILERAKVQP